MLVQCCVCNRIEAGGAWEAADGVIFDASHTYCPDCAEHARTEIDEYWHALHQQVRVQTCTGSLPLRRRSAVYGSSPANGYRGGVWSCD
jgi:hypothetical protein